MVAIEPQKDTRWVLGVLAERRDPIDGWIEGDERAWTGTESGRISPVLVEWAVSVGTGRGKANDVQVRADSMFDRSTDSYQYVALPLGRIVEGDWLANSQLGEVCHNHFVKPGGHSGEVAGPIPFPGEGYRGNDTASNDGSNGVSSDHELSSGEWHGLPISTQVVNRTVRTIVRSLQGRRS